MLRSLLTHCTPCLLVLAGLALPATAAELTAATSLRLAPEVEASAAGAVVASPNAATTPVAAPHAVVPFSYGGLVSTEEVRQALMAVAAKINGDDSLFVSLRSFVPETGSLEFGIGMAEQALQRVRQELIALGVKPRRILRETLRDFGVRNAGTRRQGVEVYVGAKRGEESR